MDTHTAYSSITVCENFSESWRYYVWFIRDSLVDALRVVSPRYRTACKFHSAESILLAMYTIPANFEYTVSVEVDSYG